MISAKPRGMIEPALNQVAAANRSAALRPILPKGEAKSMSEHYDRRQNVRRLHRHGRQHGGVMAERGGKHKAVPDRVLKTQAPPRMEDNAG